MTDPCAVLRCHEPRQHGYAWCPIHFELVPAPIQHRYKYALSMIQKCPETSGPILERRAVALKQAREDVTEAIQDALEERRQVG